MCHKENLKKKRNEKLFGINSYLQIKFKTNEYLQRERERERKGDFCKD